MDKAKSFVSFLLKNRSFTLLILIIFALILVHRKQLLDQWIERIQSFLGIPKKDIGKIADGKKIIGKELTVAMMQSLIKMTGEEKEKITNPFGTIIIDECHHIPAKTFRELITQFNPYYLYVKQLLTVSAILAERNLIVCKIYIRNCNDLSSHFLYLSTVIPSNLFRS